jgi:hypothetical protein
VLQLLAPLDSPVSGEGALVPSAPKRPSATRRQQTAVVDAGMPDTSNILVPLFQAADGTRLLKRTRSLTLSIPQSVVKAVKPGLLLPPPAHVPAEPASVFDGSQYTLPTAFSYSWVSAALAAPSLSSAFVPNAGGVDMLLSTVLSHLSARFSDGDKEDLENVSTNSISSFRSSFSPEHWLRLPLLLPAFREGNRVIALIGQPLTVDISTGTVGSTSFSLLLKYSCEPASVSFHILSCRGVPIPFHDWEVAQLSSVALTAHSRLESASITPVRADILVEAYKSSLVAPVFTESGSRGQSTGGFLSPQAPARPPQPFDSASAQLPRAPKSSDLQDFHLLQSLSTSSSAPDNVIPTLTEQVAQQQQVWITIAIVYRFPWYSDVFLSFYSFRRMT